jgi:hypothetical protein
VPFQEWAYDNAQYISGYYYNYYCGEWNTCLEGGLPPFPLPHPMTNGYFYHQQWLPDLDGRCHYWSDLHKYGVANIHDYNTCNNDGCLGENIITCWVSIRKWLHSPCYWNVWLSSFSFWFIFYHLCTDHYCASLTIFFSLFDACFLLLTTCVHNLVVCTNHSNSSMGCYIWSGFFIFLPHIITNAPPSLTDLWKVTTFSS